MHVSYYNVCPRIVFMWVMQQRMWLPARLLARNHWLHSMAIFMRRMIPFRGEQMDIFRNRWNCLIGYKRLVAPENDLSPRKTTCRPGKCAVWLLLRICG